MARSGFALTGPSWSTSCTKNGLNVASFSFSTIATTDSTSVFSSCSISSSSYSASFCEPIAVRRLKLERMSLNNVELDLISLALVWLSTVDRSSSRCSSDASKPWATACPCGLNGSEHLLRAKVLGHTLIERTAALVASFLQIRRS